MAAELRNVAFKVTWVYGEDGPWGSPCTPEGRLINIRRESKVWCSQAECPCRQLLDTDEMLPAGSPPPCYDYRALRDPWRPFFGSGTFHQGPRAGRPIPMKQTGVGKFAFLTSRRYGIPEEDRRILACFRIDRCEPLPPTGETSVAADTDSPYSLRVPLDRLDDAPRYWDFCETDQKRLWGSGLFRYVPDEEADAMREALAAACEGVDVTVWRDIETARLEDEYLEGQRTTRLVSYYERNPALRSAAIAIHGFRCQVCDLAFGERYGALGEGFIEVHHLKPVADYKGEVSVDPEADMAVVCPNCHRMLHRDPEAPITVEELRRLLLRTEQHR